MLKIKTLSNIRLICPIPIVNLNGNDTTDAVNKIIDLYRDIFIILLRINRPSKKDITDNVVHNLEANTSGINENGKVKKKVTGGYDACVNKRWSV